MTTPYVEKGQLVALAVTGTARLKAMPNVPTFKELGLTEPIYATRMWFGLYAPANTPPAIVDKVSAEVKAVLREPDFVQLLAEQAYDVEATTPAEFASRIRDDQREILRMMKDMRIEQQ